MSGIRGALIPQIEIYRMLKANPGKAMSAAEIGETVGEKVGAVRYFCKRMYLKGCVHRAEYGTRHTFRYWIGEQG